MTTSWILLVLVLVSSLAVSAGVPQSAGTYANSLVLAPLYVDYLLKTPEKFAADASALKQRIGSAPYVMLGFAAFLDVDYPGGPLDQPITESDMDVALGKAERIVSRARENGIISHVSIISGFFHGTNELRRRAIHDDVRNAQWFADGLIAPATNLTTDANAPTLAWVTPSRYALPLRTRIEEGTRILGRKLAKLMAQYPDTLVTISGDGEAEFTYERNFANNGENTNSALADVIYTDYSPFMVEEFRDWLRRGRYDGDSSPASDDDRNGHTFNGDFKQSFATWRLRYFDNSGPIPYADYLRLPEKLPSTGLYAVSDGFDAPRKAAPEDVFWTAWLQFRREVIADWVQDYASWITTSPDPSTGFEVPVSRFYSHQIPADLIFGESDNLRLKTSASYIETAVLEPGGGTGVTAFNGFDGKRHVKTATPQLYASLFMTSDNWGILEYNPSMPYANSIAASNDSRYYINELRLLYNFRPHVVVPFAWTDLPEHKRFSIQGTMFEKSLKQFVQEIGRTPWFSWRKALR